MCGIAGYNASKDFIQKWFPNEEVQKNVIREGWLHNLHRGYDAAGYMGHTMTERTASFKAPGNAVDILMEYIDPAKNKIEIMQTLGLHTRQYTLGDPKVNENNHPLTYKGIYVTHNGQIPNHKQLRIQHLTVKERADLAEVDSAIIPVVLAKKMKHAFDTEGLRSALRSLNGSFTIHAIWDMAPGVSVLARGTGRPLVCAYIPGEALVYGSEKEAVWGMISAMGINPHKHWDWWTLDSDHYLILDNGEVAKYGTFRKTTHGALPYVSRRWLPPEESDQKAQLVYESDKQYDYINRADPTSILGREDEAELRYTRQNGFTKKTDSFPFKGDMELGAVLSEADYIFDNGDFWHVFFGNIEIVVNDNRVIKDIFNHDLFDTSQRFSLHKKAGATDDIASTLSWKDFVRNRTSGVYQIPTKRPEYQYVLDMKNAVKQHNKKTTESKGPKVNISSIRDTSKKNEGSGAPQVVGQVEEMALLMPQVTVNWENAYDQLVLHETEPIGFLTDSKCPEHDQLWSKHHSVLTCDQVLKAASYAMCAVVDIGIYSYFDPTTNFENSYSKEWCGNKKGVPPCDWVTNEFIRVYNKTSCWDVSTAQICSRCKSKRRVIDIPEPLRHIDTSGRINSGDFVHAN